MRPFSTTPTARPTIAGLAIKLPQPARRAAR